MNITDTIVIVCGFFLLGMGFVRGFLGSLLGPLGLILGSALSYAYYILTKDLMVSLCIGLFGPFVLTWIFRTLLRSWNKASNPEEHINIFSRLAGAVLSLAWGMTMLVICILLLAIIPPINKPLEQIGSDIHQSQTYSFVKIFLPAPPAPPPGTKVPTTQENIQALSSDQRIQDIVNDPEIADAIKRKDYASLISNPKIKTLMQDPEMIKKILSVYKDLPAAQQQQTTTSP